MKPAKSQEHEGWSNYETWATALHLNNDEPAYNYWRYVARHTEGNKRERIAELANALKDQLTDLAPNLGATFYADLLTAALGEVDWREIAEDIIGNL